MKSKIKIEYFEHWIKDELEEQLNNYIEKHKIKKIHSIHGYACMKPGYFGLASQAEWLGVCLVYESEEGED